MSTTLEAPTDQAADEALEEMSAAERLAKAAATGKTAEERGERTAPPAGQHLDQISWDEIVGGALPTEEKMAFAGTAFNVMEVPEGGIRKGTHYVMVIDVVAVGHSVMDSLDTETADVTKTKLTKKVRVRSARFLKPTEIVVEDPELAARADEYSG